MEFQINYSSFTEIFPVPKAVVQENLLLASPLSLKALLLLLCDGGGLTTQRIAQTLKRDVAEVEDALLFWVERGVLLRAGEKPQPVAAPLQTPAVPAPPAEAPPKKEVAPLPLSRPTHEEIAARVAECEAFRDLFAEAQLKLGKTIGYEGQSLLIMLHDTYDLPLEVILMLLEYAKSKGKTGYKFIASLGREWSEHEIDSLEAAEEYISALHTSDALWEEFRARTDAKNRNPTAKQRRFLTAWSKELQMSTEMILLAYEICIDNTGKLSLEYMDKVLRNWSAKQISTPQGAEAEKKQWAEKNYSAGAKKKKTAAKAGVYSSDASYDLEAYRKSAIGLRDYVPKTNDDNG